MELTSTNLCLLASWENKSETQEVTTEPIFSDCLLLTNVIVYTYIYFDGSYCNVLLANLRTVTTRGLFMLSNIF